MLSHEDNELLCRVGPGTPMGELMRRFWFPALPSYEFAGPDSPPKRMRLLGEDLVMFRDTSGAVGALRENCPHRGASLYFGRNEDCGLRCAYHGWKFATDGTCLDTLTEPPARSGFTAKVRARSYRCHEVNHMVWIYMGPDQGAPPPFPLFEVNTLPAANVAAPVIMMEEANWLQNMEGDLDSAHLDWVHRRLREDSPAPEIGMEGTWNPDHVPPALDVRRTPYGAFYSAKRTLPEGEWHRISQYIFPFFTMITTGTKALGLRSFVPLDDHHTMLISQWARPDREIFTPGVPDPFAEAGGYVERTSDPRTYYLTAANRRNDYLRDMKVQEERMFLGVPFIHNLQDRAMTELMGNDAGEPVYDRTQEHLGSSDQMVIAVRRMLKLAVEALRDRGEAPTNLADPSLDRVRAVTLLVERGQDWEALSAPGRDADSGVDPSDAQGVVWKASRSPAE